MPKETHDPRVLRAIAHPTRGRILAELSAAGSLRAADVARELEIPANQASFHLRQLAKYGLVQEDPDAARDQRDRVWRLVDETGFRFELDDMVGEPGGKAAAEVFRRNFGERCRFLAERAMAHGSTDDEVRTVNDSSLRLSKEEAAAFQRDLGEVYLRWREKTRSDDTERTTYSFLTILQPYPDLDEGR